MILWFTVVQIVVAVLAGVLGVVLGLAGKRPNDYILGALALVELLIIAQVVTAIIAPAVGNPPTGSLLEFWIYLGTAVFMPPLAVIWALVDRSRWSTVVLGVAGLAIAIMTYRMHQIWTVQLA